MKMRTITVERLLEVLQDEDPTAQVIFSADYGDYSHTPQALPIDGEVEEVFIEKSAYSNSGFAVVEDEEDANARGAASEQKYLVIR